MNLAASTTMFLAAFFCVQDEAAGGGTVLGFEKLFPKVKDGPKTGVNYGPSQTWKAEADGTGMRAAPEKSLVSDLFSPDGARVLLVDAEGRLRWRDLKSGEENALPELKWKPERILLSPDGSTLYFSAMAGRERHIFRMDADGGNVRQLTTDRIDG